MRVDLYTKAVLTVIALCLVYMCFGKPSFSRTLEAQYQIPLPSSPVLAPGATEVVIVGWKGTPSQRGVVTLGEAGLPVKNR